MCVFLSDSDEEELDEELEFDELELDELELDGSSGGDPSMSIGVGKLVWDEELDESESSGGLGLEGA